MSEAVSKNPISNGIQFLKDSYVEIKKVSHPTRQETIQATIAVFFMVFFFSIFMGLIDLGLGKIFHEILT